MGARRDSAAFHLERINLNSHLSLRSLVAHPLTILKVTTATVSAAYARVSERVRACFSNVRDFASPMRVCVPLCDFPVCYSGQNGGRGAGIGEVYVACHTQRVTRRWPSAVCFSGVCAVSRSPHQTLFTGCV